MTGSRARRGLAVVRVVVRVVVRLGVLAVVLDAAALSPCIAALAQSARLADSGAAVEGAVPFSFAVAGSAASESTAGTRAVLRGIEGSPARFVVHFDVSTPSHASCSDAGIDRRRDALEASAKPVVPVVAASEWAVCGNASPDPLDRLARVGDTLFGADQSLGQTRLHWVRQSASTRFNRYRENVRWQVGNVLFVALNLPDGNNNFRHGAGRNGEFEERLVANRAWLERAFRLAAERRLAGIAIFVDAAPRFGLPMRTPDLRTPERDGFYESKLALRDLTSAFKGQVLLVQGHVVPQSPPLTEPDHPLRDAAGKALPNFTRIALPDAATAGSWMRIDVDPATARLFRISVERAFDDPSGELYGPARAR